MRGTAVIVCTHAGFAVQRGGVDVVHVKWDDVVQVLAFVRDEITVDMICMAVRTHVGEDVLIDEDAEGWDAWLLALDTALPGARWPDMWLPALTRPAFSSAVVVLFDR